MQTVVAALIQRGGQILICRRTPGELHPLKWEFPGGKVEPGETPVQALRRELMEELAIEAEIGAEMERHEFSYPGKGPLLLIFFAVTEFGGEPRNCVFHEIRWVEYRQLPEFDFLEGDRDLVMRLAVG